MRMTSRYPLKNVPDSGVDGSGCSHVGVDVPKACLACRWAGPLTAFPCVLAGHVRMRPRPHASPFAQVCSRSLPPALLSPRRSVSVACLRSLIGPRRLQLSLARRQTSVSLALAGRGHRPRLLLVIPGQGHDKSRGTLQPSVAFLSLRHPGLSLAARSLLPCLRSTTCLGCVASWPRAFLSHMVRARPSFFSFFFLASVLVSLT